ncbi:MAG: hypothetical protein KJ667_08070 [Alphaproteobacteria bacterium]|nr:hypothetical protein [Alphaproteobacteria bacterium]
MRYILTFVLAFLLSGAAVQAQVIDQNIIKVVPHYLDEMSDVDFLARTQPLKETPMGDRFLSYEVRLPLGWAKAEDSDREVSSSKSGLSSRLLGNVTRFYGPTRIDAVDIFQIEAMTLDYELSVRNWFLNYVFTRGYTLQGMEEIGEQAIEAQYVTLIKDTAYVFRVRAYANGPRVLVISYAVPEQHWERERGIQERVIRSFRFLSPEKILAEHVRTYPFLDLLRFDYPSSWRLIAPNIYSIEGMDAKVVSTADKKTVAGEIDVRVISTELDTSLADEVKYLKEDIQERGLKVGKMIEVGEGYKFHDHILYDRVEIYEAKDESRKIQDHELWLAVMVEDRYFYIITMLTPGRASDFYTWAKNSEAFEIVTESMRP